MKNVQNTHLSEQLSVLHRSIMDIVAVMNRPQRDDLLLKAAGLSLERALFPLLVVAAKYGPIGIVEMAEGIGRDYTTVSRQVARLEQIGLVERKINARDRRIREVVVSEKGRLMTNQIDEARERIARTVFAEWNETDIDQLVCLIRRLADAMMETPKVDRSA